MVMVRFACETVFSQISPSITDLAIRKLSSFIQLNVIPNATNTIAFLCGSLGGHHSLKRLEAFFPICKSKILSELEAGASSIPSASHLSANTNPLGFAQMSDAPFHYYQAILNQCVMYSGTNLLLFKEDLKSILDLTLEKSNSRVGYTWSVKLLSNIFLSLLFLYPKEQLSHSPDLWSQLNSNSSEDDLPHTLWGKCTHLKDLKMEWHAPSPDEIQFSIELIERYTPIVLNKIQDALDHPGDSLSHYISRWLAWTKYLLIGLVLLLEPVNQQQDLPLFDDAYVHPYKRATLHCGHPISKDSNPQLYEKLLSFRHEIGKTFILIGSKFKSGLSEDSVEAANALVTNLHFYMSFTGIDKSKMDTFASDYKFMKASLKMIEDGKNLPRTLLIKRIYMIHLAHLRRNSVVYEPLFDQMIDIIFSFCINKYSLIRNIAQSAFGKCLQAFPHYRLIYFPKLLQIIDTTKSDVAHFDDIIQGAIQTLRGESLLCLRNWEFSRPLMKSILNTKSIEKPATLELLRKLFMEFLLECIDNK